MSDTQENGAGLAHLFHDVECGNCCRSGGFDEEHISRILSSLQPEMLVQIPAVRELVVELADIESQFGDDYLFQKHNEAHVRPWLDALEATEGDA